ncbi:MAG: hypothetical protein V2A79_19945 [Planctomycetota bacterium]
MSHQGFSWNPSNHDGERRIGRKAAWGWIVLVESAGIITLQKPGGHRHHVRFTAARWAALVKYARRNRWHKRSDIEFVKSYTGGAS